MVSLGITDFTAGVYGRKEGAWSAIFLNEIIGLLLISIIILFKPTLVIDLVSYPFFDISLLVFASTLNFLAIVCLIYGFTVGNIGIVSALGSSFNLIVILLTWLVLGEGLSIISLTFLLILVVGVFLSMIEFSGKYYLAKGSVCGLFALIMWGISFFLMIFLSREISLFTLLFSNFVVGFLLSFIYFLVKRRPVLLKKSIWLIVVSALAELIAYVFLYLAGSVEGSGGVVGAITGSYAVISVLLGYFFLKEKLSKTQIIGIVLILISITAISIFN
ncbi:MAG: DMT family transporter [bacterium]|nr:DMT family transporter [bacterium]